MVVELVEVVGELVLPDNDAMRTIGLLWPGHPQFALGAHELDRNQVVRRVKGRVPVLTDSCRHPFHFRLH
jgi:hypothetical protein